MSLPAFAQLEDLEARMDLTGVDPARAQARLDDASARIRSVSHPVTWVDDEGDLVDDVPGILLTICCAAAQRSLENPLGVQSETETVVSYSEQRTYGNSSSDVYLRKQEVADIRRAAGLHTVAGLSSVRVIAPAEASGTRYASAWFEDDQISESDG